jgi:hypothetical protein
VFAPTLKYWFLLDSAVETARSGKLIGAFGPDSFPPLALREGDSMRPKERRDGGQNDLFRAWLDQIVDMGHPLARLAATSDRRFLEERFGAVYSDKPGQPPLPTRLMPGFRSSSTRTICPTRSCARASSRTRTSSSSAARILPPQAAVRPVVADALAPTHGRSSSRW